MQSRIQGIIPFRTTSQYRNFDILRRPNIKKE